ncbi:MAG: ATP-binding protein [Verrucomicrobiae bacterium]|nr:ATP-binding protein [Verrucomicrobiae bacterium]
MLLDPGAAVDDGKCPGIGDLIFGSPQTDSVEVAPIELPHDTGEPADYLLDLDPEPSEILITPSSRITWPPRDFETLLYSIAVQKPVCFEYLADANSIRLQLAVSESVASQVAATVAYELDGSVVELVPPFIESWILEPEPRSLWTCELALHTEFMFPIPTPKELRRDPHVDLLSVFGSLQGDERVAVQIRFEPCMNRWSESIWRLITMEDGKPFFAEGKVFMDAAKAKLGKPLFAATIRLSILGASDEREDAIKRMLFASFSAYEGGNTFTVADDDGCDAGEKLYHIIHRKSRRSGMLLNGDELLGLVHLPEANAGSPKLARIKQRSRPAPEVLRNQTATRLGINRHHSEEHEVGLSMPERLRHMHVLGASGTGKSTFLLNSILQDLSDGHGLALLDPHGDLVEGVLDRLPKNRVNDLVLFDPADVEYPVGFNILRAHSEIEKNLLASDFVAIFERLSSSWGDQMTAVLGNAAMAFLESDRGGTLMDLKRFLIEKGFRDRFLHSVRDPEIRYFWQKEFPLLRGTTQASLLTRLNGFLRHRLIRNMVRQSGEKFDVATMMDEGKIILAPLSQGLIGQENSWLLGSLLVSRFYQAALSRQSISEANRRPFFLYLDEAHHFVTPSIASILSGSRKYGLGLILAHQSMEQFPSRESGILDSILTNCHTRIYFRLGERDAPKVEHSFDHFESEDFRRLPTGEAICRVGGSDSDFNLSTHVPPPSESEGLARRETAVQQSRSRYATPRAEVEIQTNDTNELPVQSTRELKTDRKTPKPPPQENAGQDDSLPQSEVTEANSAERWEPVPTSELAETLPGRGGSRHKFLQNLIKQHANGLGLKATVEASLPENSGSVDVLVEGKGVSIAFEVALKSPLEQEVHNIRKAVESGIPRVIVTSEDSDHLGRIQQRAQSDALQLDGIVEFLHADQLDEVFAILGAELAGYEKASRGYTVRVRHSPLSEDERSERLAAIHRAIAENQQTQKRTQD